MHLHQYSHQQVSRTCALIDRERNKLSNIWGWWPVMHLSLEVFHVTIFNELLYRLGEEVLALVTLHYASWSPKTLFTLVTVFGLMVR